MNELRIDVADLLTHPGSRRALRVEAAIEALGTRFTTVADPVVLDLSLARVPEGVLVRGTLEATYEAQCSHCLRPVRRSLQVEASELFEDFPVDGQTYPIDGHVVDLEQFVRDALVLELPLAPTCPAGDPGCVADPAASATDSGSDTGSDTDAVTAPADPRWAVLSRLEL